MEFIYIIIGIICGVIVGALFMKSKISGLAVKYDMLTRENEKINSDYQELAKRAESLTLESQNVARERDRLSYEKESLKESFDTATTEWERQKEELETNYKTNISELKNQNVKSLEDLKAENSRQKQEAAEQSRSSIKTLREESEKSIQELKEQYEKQIQELKLQYEKQIAALKEDFLRQKKETADLHEKAMIDLDKACNSALASQEKRHNEAVNAMQERFNETMEKVTAQVKNATENMLKDRQKEFSEKSNMDLGQIVNPLRETIDKMKKAMEDSTIKQTEMSSEMRTNIENMIRHSQAAKESADELTRVFKHESKIQGDWGETILDELLQSQGLKNGIHYDTQAVIRDASGNLIKTEEGASMRPDIILHLDQKRELIIDSKVSLTAFMDFANAETEEERQKYLKAHINSLKKHVDELSNKDYSSYIQPPKVKMNYVIMFVPHTGSLWTALKAQPDLWRKAMDKNVFIADEQTLFAALRIINMTWTQIAQAQNHERVFDLANEMLNRVGQFWTEYVSMGKALDSLQKAYAKGKEKITDGGQSINTTANKLIKLGAKQSEKNPLPKLLDIDDIPALEQ